MTIDATRVPLSETKARLSELVRRVREHHDRITLTRNGGPEAVLLSVDDLEGMELTLEVLGDSDAVARISESLAANYSRGPDAASRHWSMTTNHAQRSKRRFPAAALWDAELGSKSRRASSDTLEA